MPDMSGRPRGICHPVNNNLFNKDNNMEADLAKALHGSTSSWVNQNTKLSDEGNEDADLQRAIALSLQDDPFDNVSTNKNTLEKIEEEDLARALAQSITDISNSQCNFNNAASEMKYNCSDPKKLVRKDEEWPVGLQNIGNTCWFNVVVQSLFHLPSFRSLIFQFTSSLNNSGLSNETQRSLHLVHELRCLFALMLASRRSFLNPGKLVSIFQDSASRNRQQDASEFIHILLEQLEEAFHYDEEVKIRNDRQTLLANPGDFASDLIFLPDASRKKLTNPMLEMFYGTYKSIGEHQGIPLEQDHTFSILPLCVKSQQSLHSSLEHATVKATPSGHEVWFTNLPPVLIFQLSRFQFNQYLQATEKVHDSLSFPSVIYMDRYLEANKETTKSKREEAAEILAKLAVQKSSLNRLLHYPVGTGHLCLSDVLSASAEFACEMTSSDQLTDNPNPFISTRRRLGSTSPSGGLSPCKRSKDDSLDEKDSDTTDSAMSVASKSNSDGTLSPNCTHLLSRPTEGGAEMVESTLRKWKVMVDQEITDLKNKIKADQLVLDRLYEEASLHHCPYSLHAVLVHQGEALAGHYWAYIRDHSKERWLKFNDVTVTEASYEQLHSDSVGSGFSAFDSSASAYCLIYTDSRAADLFTESGDISSDAFLSELVKTDNIKLESELDKLKAEQQSKATHTGSASTSGTELGSSSPLNLKSLRRAIEKVSTPNESISTEQAVMQQDNASETQIVEETSISVNTGDITLPDEEGVLCPTFQASLLSILKIGDIYNLQGVEAALDSVVREEYERLKALSQEARTISSDPRLLSIVVYMFQNEAPNNLIEYSVLEQFTDPRLKYEAMSRDIMRCASSILDQRRADTSLLEEYEIWRKQYVTFRVAVHHLIEALQLFRKRRFYDCVCHLVTVHEHNKCLVDGANPDKEVNIKFVASYRRTCIQRIHEDAMSLVVSENHMVAQSGLKKLRTRLIPCMAILLSPDWGGGGHHDLQLADTIRDMWCSLLEKELVIPRDELSESLTEFLDSNPLSARSIAAADMGFPPANLYQLFEETMTSLQHQQPARA